MTEKEQPKDEEKLEKWQQNSVVTKKLNRLIYKKEFLQEEIKQKQDQLKNWDFEYFEAMEELKRLEG